jgi:hypothetical protein
LGRRWLLYIYTLGGYIHINIKAKAVHEVDSGESQRGGGEAGDFSRTGGGRFIQSISVEGGGVY